MAAISNFIIVHVGAGGLEHAFFSLLMQFGGCLALCLGKISAMQQALHRSSLVPRGFVVEGAYSEGDKAVIEVRAPGSVGLCPLCGTVPRRVPSRPRRRGVGGRGVRSTMAKRAAGMVG